MSPALENFLRGGGAILAAAILGYIAQATNLTGVIPGPYIAIVSGLAGALLAALDAVQSPAGTVGFGLVGSRR